MLDEIQQNKDDALKKLQDMQEEVDFTPKPPAQRVAAWRSVLQRIPIVRVLLRNIDVTGKAATSMINISGSVFKKTSIGLQATGVALDAINFFSIPIIYLAAYAAKEPVPFTLSNNAKWFYAGILLGLSITSLALPPIAPIIAITLSSVIFTVELFTLGTLIKEYRDLKKESLNLSQELINEEAKFKELKQKAQSLEKTIAKYPGEVLPEHLSHEATDLKGQYEQQKEKIQGLHHKILENKAKLGDMNWMKGLDKTVAIVIAALTLAGTITALLFPPVGLALVISAGVVGASFCIGRLTAPLVARFGEWVKGKPAQEPAVKLDAEPEKNDDLPENSLVKALNGMGVDPHRKIQTEEYPETEITEQVQPTPLREALELQPPIELTESTEPAESTKLTESRRP